MTCCLQWYSGKGFDGYIGKWGRFDGSGNQLLGWDGVRMFRVEEDASSGEQYNIYSDQACLSLLELIGSQQRRCDREMR